MGRPKKKPLSRRAFLRGAGGIAISLPFLDAMIPTFANAQTSAAPLRALIALGGTCQTGRSIMTPSAVGALPTTLATPWQSLQPIRQQVSILSGLAMTSWQTGTPPPGGVYNQQHGTSPTPILTGVHSIEAQPLINAQSADQYIADAIAGSTRIKSLQVRCQAAGYNGGNSDSKGYMSARKSGTGPLQALKPVVSPLALYDALFSAGLPTGTTTTPAPLSLNLRKQKSVLDYILGDANRVMASLDSNDKARVDQHFTEIRDLETRLLASTGGGGTSTAPTASCQLPAKPGADTPPSTLAFGGWANETARGDLQADLIAMAFICDITRVASWMLTFDQCFLGTATMHTSGASDMHDLTHNGTAQQLATHVAWHTARWARLVKRLSEVPEAGGTVLDNTFLTLLFTEGEGAHGRAYYNYLIAGRPSKLKMGQHISAVGTHPAKLLIGGMQSLGMSTSTLGEISGPFAGMMR